MSQQIRYWWCSVPEWAKPVILGAALGLLAWLFTWLLPAMRRWLYGHILWKLKNSQSTLELFQGMYDEPYSEDDVIKNTPYPKWLARRAIRWQERKLAENEKPPFRL
jgi:hypothetical protein